MIDFRSLEALAAKARAGLVSYKVLSMAAVDLVTACADEVHQ